jgi:hypothetical protein
MKIKMQHQATIIELDLIKYSILGIDLQRDFFSNDI